MPSNEDIFYLWLTNSLLPILKPDGVWIAPDPSPLTADEVTAIFERVIAHKSYQRQELVTATYDDLVVRVKDGEITRTSSEGTPWEGKPHVFPREGDEQ